jgi:8-oxo-dGTP diphosphatase
LAKISLHNNSAILLYVNAFVGVKIGLLLEDKLIVIQRDNKPGLRFAGLWDFPGGGRDGQESPFECAAREIDEELAVTLKPSSIVWQTSRHYCRLGYD